MSSCPDDNQLAAFMDGGLSREERSLLERHIDGCALCRGLLGDVVMGATRQEGAAREPPPTPPGILRTGDMVDHFYVMRELGAGGMGRVYLARDTQLGRKVALKLIQPSLASSRQVVKMFRREARAMAHISHPNIVTVHSVGEHENVPYVALEYVHGDTLRQRFHNRPAPPIEALSIGLGLAEGLAEAHRHGIVHRDLKPSNVLLDAGDRPRIVDFGLADFVRDRGDAHGHTDAATFLDTSHTSPSDGGTPSYMAPEQWRGEAVTGATDVWALGVILWEILSGARLFQGKSEVDLAGQICGREPVPSVTSKASVPPEVSALVAACLDRQAAARPTASDLTVRLRRCIEALELTPLMVRRAVSTPPMDDAPTLRRRPDEAVSAEPPRPRSETPGAVSDLDERGANESTRVIVIAGAAALLLAGLGAVGVGAGTGQSPAAPSHTALPAPSVAPPTPARASATPSASATVSSSASARPVPAPRPRAIPPRRRTRPEPNIFEDR